MKCRSMKGCTGFKRKVNKYILKAGQLTMSITRDFIL